MIQDLYKYTLYTFGSGMYKNILYLFKYLYKTSIMEQMHNKLYEHKHSDYNVKS